MVSRLPTLLAAILITANAQAAGAQAPAAPAVIPAVPLPAAPSTKPQAIVPPAPQVSVQPQEAMHVTKGATVPGPIDKSKCLDIDNAEKVLREDIRRRIHDASTGGLMPSLAYENGGSSSASLAARVDSRASDQAASLSGALFAAVKNPSNPANAASLRLNGSETRRASMSIYARCAEQDSKPRKVVENSTYMFNDSVCKSGSTPADVGINSNQVWQTKFSPEKVMVRFAQAKATSTDDNSVGICKAGRRACAQNGPGTYAPMDSSSFTPALNKEYYFEDTTSFGFDLLVWKPSMSNRTAVKVSPIDVCGAKAYLVTSFQNGSSKGMDTGTLLGLIAQVGSQTLVIGDVSTQAFSQESWALQFPDHYQKIMKAVLNTGYQGVSDVIGATERPVMGEIGGFPYPQKGTPGAPAATTKRIVAQ